MFSQQSRLRFRSRVLKANNLNISFIIRFSLKRINLLLDTTNTNQVKMSLVRPVLGLAGFLGFLQNKLI